MILQVSHVDKLFGGLHALSNVSFEVSEGEILGLIGPNGAGKTTMFNVISGIYSPNAGSIVFRGKDVTGKRPYRLARMGLARTYQIVRPLNDLSVRENVVVGACFGREGHPLGTGFKVADEVLEFVGLADRAHQLAGSLNVGQKKRLEMARALAARPYLLLLDEVAAHLDPDRRRALFDEICALGVQAWMTGTDRALFAALGDRGRHFDVREQDGLSRITETEAP